MIGSITRGVGQVSIRADIQAIFERDPAATNVLEVLLTNPGLHALLMHRLAHALQQRGVPVMPRVIAHINRWITGIEIHPAAKIGRGLLIDHGMGVVIGETSEIGDNVTLSQDVTLGGTGKEKGKRHPTVGNNVTVGVGAKILGAVTIGEGARIGAGAVVLRDVPSNATAVGVPAKAVIFDPPGASAQRIEHLPDPDREMLALLQQKADELGDRIAVLETRLRTKRTTSR